MDCPPYETILPYLLLNTLVNSTLLPLLYLQNGSIISYDAIPTTTSTDPAPCFPFWLLLLGPSIR